MKSKIIYSFLSPSKRKKPPLFIFSCTSSLIHKSFHKHAAIFSLIYFSFLHTLFATKKNPFIDSFVSFIHSTYLEFISYFKLIPLICFIFISRFFFVKHFFIIISHAAALLQSNFEKFVVNSNEKKKD